METRGHYVVTTACWAERKISSIGFTEAAEDFAEWFCPHTAEYGDFECVVRDARTGVKMKVCITVEPLPVYRGSVVSA